MASNALNIGNVQNIIDALLAAGAKVEPARVDRHGYQHGAKLVVGNDSACEAVIQAARAKMDAQDFAKERDRLLCSAQMVAWGMGWKPATLGTNMYGYAVGCTLDSNLGGGRWAMTQRGLSLEEAIKWAVRFAQTPNQTVSMDASFFPTEVLTAFGATTVPAPVYLPRL